MSTPPEPAAPTEGPSAAPPIARDPWAWVSALAVIPLVLASRGAPFGEPAAEDFDYLHHALIGPTRTLLDGGGSEAFWRPLSYQLYYGAFGPLLLSHPLAVACVHALLLALAAVLLQRALRPSLGGPLSAAVGTFPLLAESTRILLVWPGVSSDLGLFLFSALALHEASRRRLPSALAALTAALLCKELAVVTAVLLPFLPGIGARGRHGRATWLAGCGLVLVAWAAAYTWVRRHAGLELPHALERDATLLATPLFERMAWAARNSLRAAFSLALAPGRWDLAVGGALWLVLIVSALVTVRGAAARARVRARAGWIAWGVAWFALGAAALASIFPLWSPNRSQYASLGLGVSAVAFTAAAHPALAGALVATRLAALALGPPADARITPEPAERGAFVDFPRITRLQLLMRRSRAVLLERHPTLPQGARVGSHNLPLAAEYAYGGSRALQLWYRDTTLRTVAFKDWRADSLQPVAVFLDYQPDARLERQLVLLDTGALRAKLEGTGLLRAGRWAESLAALDSARTLQRDTAAYIFTGDVAGRRAYVLVALGRFDEARREARAALDAWPLDVGARFVVALLLAQERHRVEALAQLDTLLALAPEHAEALALRRLLTAPPPSPSPPR